VAGKRNPRGLVIEMILPARIAGDKPRAFRQVVLFDGVVLERATTFAAPTKHWRSTAIPDDGALDVLDPSSWLGRWIEDHATGGYEIYGKPFLIEANPAEKGEIDAGNMPRALVLRLDKSRAEIGVVTNPWTGK